MYPAVLCGTVSWKQKLVWSKQAHRFTSRLHIHGPAAPGLLGLQKLGLELFEGAVMSREGH